MNIFVPTRWTFLKLLACPLVSTTLGLILLEIGVHNDHRAGAGVDIVREYEVQLGSLQIQMKFYLEKMKLR